jgi:hypothetical protein
VLTVPFYFGCLPLLGPIALETNQGTSYIPGEID